MGTEAAPVLRSLVNVVTGRGGRGIRLKREYHRQRAAAEQEALASPGWLRPNHCPCCGEGHVATLVSPQGLRFAQCPADGTVYAQPVPTNDALAWMQNHASQSWPFLQSAAEAPNVDELAAMERLIPKRQGARLLDVGCGTGAFLLAARHRYSVKGIDPHVAAVEVARARGLDVEVGTVEQRPSKDRFDVVTLICVLEHSADPGGLLGACRKRLEPDGCLYVVTPNIGSVSFEQVGRRHSHLSSALNVSLFTLASLESLARRCGFEVEAHEESGGRDLSLSDVVLLSVAPSAFRHRMSFYRPRLHHAFALVEQLLPASAKRRIFPEGHATFQRAVLVPR